MSDLEHGVVLSPSTVEAMKRLAQSRATSEQGTPWVAIQELRSRVEALEAGENLRQQEEDAECAAAPAHLLVERVRNAIACEYDPKDYCWDEARAAIREVLFYLKEHELIGNYAQRHLEQEAIR